MKLIRQRFTPVERKTKRPLRICLLTVLAAGTIIALSLGACINKGITKQIMDSLARVCVQTSTLVQNKVLSRQRSLRGLAARLGDTEELVNSELLMDSLDSYCDVFGFYNIGIFGPDGKGTTNLDESMDLSDGEYFQAAMRGEEIVSESILSEDGKMNLNVFAMPIWSGNDVRAVLTATYTSSDFFNLMDEGFLEGKGNSMILNSEGKAVSCPYGCLDESECGLEECGIIHYISDNVDIFPEDESGGFKEFYYNGERYVAYITKTTINDWYVLSYIDYAYVKQEISSLQISIMLVLILLYLCVVVTIIVCIWTYRRLTNVIIETAFTDELTKVRNYEYLKIYFKSLTKEERQDKFLVVFDIDRLKFINILYGTETGDKLICYILSKFMEVLPNEQIFKGNADMFIAAMEGESDEEITRKIDRFNNSIRLDIENEKIIPFKLSYGVCKMSRSDELRLVYDNALLAKREAKGSFNRKYKFFDKIEQKKITRRRIEAAFDKALQNGEFKVWYQPKYDMRTGEICGAEALVRWVSEDGNIMNPVEFIPVLEENGKIVNLDEEVLRIVCRDLRDMERRNIPIVPVSVNLSKVHLQKAGTADRLEEIVMGARESKQNISFEITESATFGDKRQLMSFVSDLHKKGFMVDMDDYGTGSSTLKSLSYTNFDTLKLDKSFIDNIGTAKMDIILKSTIKMAKELDMKLVAEGVENEEQAKFLLNNDCFVVQGYYFSRPINRDAYTELLCGKGNSVIKTKPNRGIKNISAQD